jgi:hypothetical protein
MHRPILFAVLAVALAAPTANAQGPSWRPPAKEMPRMPRVAELRGDWMGARAPWFRGTDEVTGVAPGSLRAAGEAKPGSDVAQIARFGNGPVPAVVWSDRNGDGRADIIELYKSGGVVIQLIDGDYDGAANVMRVYDSRGTLLRQDRM